MVKVTNNTCFCTFSGQNSLCWTTRYKVLKISKQSKSLEHVQCFISEKNLPSPQPSKSVSAHVCLFVCLGLPASISSALVSIPSFSPKSPPTLGPSRPEEVHSTAQHYSECVSHLKAISLAHSPGHSDFLGGGNYLLGSWEREAFSYPPQD